MLHCRSCKAVCNIVLTHWDRVQNGQDFVKQYFRTKFPKSVNILILITLKSIPEYRFINNSASV